jgi:queuine tRNA-ribosyltransferase
MPIKFEILAEDKVTHARAGLLHTPHGVIETPIFMPVGTCATVKGIRQEELEALGVQILLGNTYHLYLRPGHELIREAGGLHRFMSWPRPILTDSGGFQVMSLKSLGKVTEDGVNFRSHLDGSSHFLSPESAVEIQWALGSDIVMCLDECVEYPANRESLQRSVELTTRWAGRCKKTWERLATSGGKGITGSTSTSGPWAEMPGSFPTLFGIVQGGTDQELRRQSAEALLEVDFEGYAIGGLAVGEPKTEMYETAEFAAGLLPRDRPRYLMGVGTPEDLLEGVASGIDMFDCVMPTRNARNACAFTSEGKIVIKNAQYARDERPLDPACKCSVCKRYSRRYLRHLFVTGEMLGPMLATHHNIHFYLDTMRRMRQSLVFGEFAEFRTKMRSKS